MPRTSKNTTPRIVQSPQNERLKLLRYALLHGGRSRKDAEGHSFLGIEGGNLVLEAVKSRLRLVTLFVTPDFFEQLEPAIRDVAEDVLLIEMDILATAVSTEAPQPIAALIEPPEFEEAELFSANPLLLVADRLQDPGNLGTLIRSAEAFGASGLICLPGTVSEWNPKCVRASAGSVFRLPILYRCEDHALHILRESGVTVLAAVADGRDAAEFPLDSPVALVIGNEGSGISAELIAKCDGRISIPCPGPVESLNAATAASVLLYEASRQRRVREQEACSEPL
jgi:TrmH family RNA methyltransferase